MKSTFIYFVYETMKCLSRKRCGNEKEIGGFCLTCFVDINRGRRLKFGIRKSILDEYKKRMEK